MKKIFLSFIASLILFATVNAQQINQKESKVDFKIGAMGFGSVKGSISDMKGVVKFNENDLSNSIFNVSISSKFSIY